jgi:hypothetical protein
MYISIFEPPSDALLVMTVFSAIDQLQKMEKPYLGHFLVQWFVSISRCHLEPRNA